MYFNNSCGLTFSVSGHISALLLTQVRCSQVRTVRAPKPLMIPSHAAALALTRSEKNSQNLPITLQETARLMFGLKRRWYGFS